MSDIDWGLAKVPDLVNTYQNAFNVGRALAAQQWPQPAAPSPSPPNAPQPELTFLGAEDSQRPSAWNPETGGGDRPMATGSATWPAAHDQLHRLASTLGGVPGPQRPAAIETADQHNEALAHALIGLRAYPPQQRLPMAQHLAASTGLIDPRMITPEDVTDEGINAHLATTMSIAQHLKQARLRATPGATEAAPPPLHLSAAPSPASLDRHGNILMGVR